MRPIAVGTTHERAFEPGPAHTAAAIGNSGVLAVSTPAILGFLEQVALEAIAPSQEAGEVSVGSRIELDHVGPAMLGAAVACRAEVVAVECRRITFAVEARQGDALVARGRYTRVVISAERFHAGSPPGAASPPRETITCYFDFHSPWSYLAVHRLPAVAKRHGRTIDWVPVHVTRLIETIGGRRPLGENAAFVKWYRQDLQDWSHRAGVTIRYHPKFPLRPARALRAAQHAIDPGHGQPFILAVMRAYWTDNLDISSPEVLGQLAQGCGLDAGAVIAATNDEKLKARIAENTSNAIAAGVFGVPTFVASGKLYFGNDRIDLLDEHLQAAQAGR
jgi:2-hydroxychromene-2-carboxylate isomerase